jgi:hypothetical protein
MGGQGREREREVGPRAQSVNHLIFGCHGQWSCCGCCCYVLVCDLQMYYSCCWCMLPVSSCICKSVVSVNKIYKRI